MPWCGGTPQQNVGELANRSWTEPKYIDRLRPLLSAASEVTAAIGLDADVGHYGGIQRGHPAASSLSNMGGAAPDNQLTPPAG
jgi:hypothetical protein